MEHVRMQVIRKLGGSIERQGTLADMMVLPWSVPRQGEWIQLTVDGYTVHSQVIKITTFYQDTGDRTAGILEVERVEVIVA